MLTDAMPIYTCIKQRGLLTPKHEIVRTLVCKQGEGVVALRFEPRTGFAQWNDRLRSRGKLGIRCEPSPRAAHNELQHAGAAQ